jgi:integrase
MGRFMAAEVTDVAVKNYQTARMKEKAAPKSINEEIGFLLRLLGEQGDFLRAKLKRQNALKLKVGHSQTARAYTPEEEEAMLTAALGRRSPSIYPALMLALNVGMRDAEIRGLQWARVDLLRAIVTVGEAKTEAGEGRTLPLNADVLAALVAHCKWYLEKFGETRPEWFVFPAGKPQPTDPTKPPTSFKTVWGVVKKKAAVTGRWHDNRHTFITDLAESGEASDETIRDLAGHVSKQMLSKRLVNRSS